MDLTEIYQENCIATMERMSDDFLDMTITSPPYHFPVEEIAASLFQKTRPGGVVVWVVGDRTLNGNETLTSFRHAITFQEAGFKVHDTMIYVKRTQFRVIAGSDTDRRSSICSVSVRANRRRLIRLLSQPNRPDKKSRPFG